MKKLLRWMAVAPCLPAANAALPPQYQNMKDLDVMVQFVRAHPSVAAELNSIDLGKYRIHFGNDCTAVFGRASTIKPPGWVGPADPLEFQDANCPVD